MDENNLVPEREENIKRLQKKGLITKPSKRVVEQLKEVGLDISELLKEGGTYRNFLRKLKEAGADIEIPRRMFYRWRKYYYVEKTRANAIKKEIREGFEKEIEKEISAEKFLDEVIKQGFKKLENADLNDALKAAEIKMKFKTTSLDVESAQRKVDEILS